VQVGDSWLAQIVPRLVGAGATVIVTFDEGSSTVGGGGHVLTIEIGPGAKPGSRNATAFDHYSLLAGIEDHFGLARLGAAAGAKPLPIGGKASQP
jgi:hypothetical protein